MPGVRTGQRLIPVDPVFSLVLTCGPAGWAGGRWPSVDWRADVLIWVGWEGDRVATRQVRQVPAGLAIAGSATPDGDLAWVRERLGLDAAPPRFSDPVLQRLAPALAGLRPYASGSLSEGLITSIIGQSISVAAAAVTEARFSALYHPAIEVDGRAFWPFPRLDQIAASDPALVRQAGMTGRRAEAIVAAAQAALDGHLPSPVEARLAPDQARTRLRTLRLVGPWTAESTLLWGIGEPDAHPTGDVALLRAARLAYARPDMTLRDLDALADGWRPARAWAARYLWTALLGDANRHGRHFGL